MTRLEFIKNQSEGRYHVYNKKSGDVLGVIEHYSPWKKWVWTQRMDIIMSWDCLREVVDFMKAMK